MVIIKMSTIKTISALLYFATLMQLTACLEEVDWELSPEQNGHLVVDAILTNEEKIQSLRLSNSYDNLNDSIPSISNAIVTVSSFSEEYAFFPVAGDPGLYQSQIPFACQKDVPYSLNVFWQDSLYTATTTLSFVAPLQEITFNNIAETDSFEILEVAPLYHPLEQAFYEINLDWTSIVPGDSSRAKMYHYTFRTVDGSELVRPPREQVIFPRGTVLIEEKFGLDDGFAEFLRALVMETEWKGGAFDEASSSLPTNISSGGLGYFAVCGVLSDTIVVE